MTKSRQTGAAHPYLNTDYLLPGQLVEEVTGRSCADEIERRITRSFGWAA
jgi:CubicO group peptidase (beta-lactamase class C family)